MEDFLKEASKPAMTSKQIWRGYNRLFVLVLAMALLWQVVGFIQMQLSAYHRALVKDVKVILTVTSVENNETLQTIGESLNAKEDIVGVKLFSPQDGLVALQTKNPRLTQALVTLGREQMPAYYEITLQPRALNNIHSFTQNLAAEYPQLSVKYAAELADMAFYSGLCLRIVNIAAALAIVFFLVFMFLIEAYPAKGFSHRMGGVWLALLAGGVSWLVLALAVYPTGLLMPALAHFTTIGRQVALLVFCGLFGWTLSKWQKF